MRPDRLIVVFLLIFLAGCGYTVRNLDSEGKEIICFGDSITAGVGAPEGKDYTSFLSALLGKDVLNAGVCGDTTQDALKRLKKDVLSKDPYLVIVELGGNDFLQKVPREVTLGNLKKIISRIQGQGVMVALADMSCGLILKGYGKDFKKLARDSGSIFIPNLLKEILNKPSLKYDYIHPNEDGYKIMADRVYRAIKNYVK